MDTKIIIFAYEKYHLERFIDYIDPSVLVVALTEQAKEELKAKGIPFKSVNDYFSYSELEDINLNSMKWLKTWSEIKLIGNKNIKEYSAYDDVSLWWYNDFWLYYSPIHHDTVKELLRYITIINKIIREEKPERVATVGSTSFLGKLIMHIAKEQMIPFKSISQGIMHTIKEFNHEIKPYLLENLKMKKSSLREILAKILFIRYKPRILKTKVVMTTFANLWQTNIDVATGAREKGDLMLLPIAKVLKGKGDDVLFVDIDYSPSLGLKSMIEKRGKAMPVEYYNSLKIKLKVLHEKGKLRKQWKEFKKNDYIKDTLKFEGYSTWPFLEKKFRHMFLKRHPEAVRNTEMLKSMMKIEKPKAVFALDETSLWGRSSVVAAKKSRVFVAGMQHGFVGKGSYEYTHLEGEAGEDYRTPLCPIPDITATYGKETADYLVKHGHYPKDTVAITGQPRYDILAKTEKIFNKENLCRGFGLDPRKKIVMLATQPIPGNEELTKEVMAAVKSVTGTQLIIKIHPREYDTKNYDYLARKIGITYTLLKEKLYEALWVCDLLVNKNSTVALEAMMLNKPVLCINLTGLPDILPLQKKGALYTSKADEIAPIIKKVLYSHQFKEKVLQDQKSIVYDYSYRIDGKAAQRVAGLLG